MSNLFHTAVEWMSERTYTYIINTKRLTNWDQVTDVLQHHISEEFSLGPVQQGPLFLSEVYSYILKGHRFLEDDGRCFQTGPSLPILQGGWYRGRHWGSGGCVDRELTQDVGLSPFSVHTLDTGLSDIPRHTLKVHIFHYRDTKWDVDITCGFPNKLVIKTSRSWV